MTDFDVIETVELPRFVHVGSYNIVLLHKYLFIFLKSWAHLTSLGVLNMILLLVCV